MVSKTYGTKWSISNLGTVPGVMEQANNFVTIISTVHKV